MVRITNGQTNTLHSLLPNKLNRPLRQRGHDFELPIIKTEGVKNVTVYKSMSF